MIFGYALIWLECLVICLMILGLLFRWIGHIRRLWLKRTIAIVLGLLILAAAIAGLSMAAMGSHLGLRPSWEFPYWLSLFLCLIFSAILWRKTLRRFSRLFLALGLVLTICGLWITAYFLGNELALRTETKAAELTAKAYANLPAPVPDNENAFVVYQGVINAISEEEANLFSSTFRDMEDLDNQELESVLSGHEHWLSEIRRASSLPGYDSHFDVKSNFIFPKFIKFRSMVYLCAIAVENHARNGRVHESLLGLQDIKTMSERMYKHPGINPYCIVGLGMRSIGKSAMEDSLYAADLSSGKEASLQFPSWKTAVNPNDLDAILDMELAYYANLFRTFGDPTCGRDAFYWKFPLGVFTKLAAVANADFQINAFETRHGNYKRIGQLPCDQIEEALEAYEASRPRDFSVIGGDYPVVGRSPIVQNKMLIINNIEKTALAVFAYKTEHGEYPGNADDLVPGYLKAIPEDYCSGGPLQMEFMEGGVTIRSLTQKGYDEDNKRYFLNTAVEFHMGTAYEKYRLEE